MLHALAPGFFTTMGNFFLGFIEAFFGWALLLVFLGPPGWVALIAYAAYKGSQATKA